MVLFPENSETGMRGNGHKLKNREVPSEHEKTLLYCEDNRTLEQIAQRGWGISISADIQIETQEAPSEHQLLQGGWEISLLGDLQKLSMILGKWL